MSFYNHNIVNITETWQVHVDTYVEWAHSHTLDRSETGVESWGLGADEVQREKFLGIQSSWRGSPGPFHGFYFQLPTSFLWGKLTHNTTHTPSCFAHWEGKIAILKYAQKVLHSTGLFSMATTRTKPYWPEGRNISQPSPPGLVSHQRRENQKATNHSPGTQAHKKTEI